MTRFVCKDGREVELEWGEDEILAWTTDKPREKIGGFNFRYLEGQMPDGSGEAFLVVNMHLEGPPSHQRSYLQQGIGREIVRMAAEVAPVLFSPHDGQTREDGSHLTGTGPSFATSMVRERLAAWDE